MPASSAPVTAQSTIGDWLAHPVGGDLLRKLLADAGFDESVLTPISNLALRQLVEMSKGQMPQATVDELVLQANGGVMPEAAEVMSSAWTERIVPGRFAGQTVIVTGAGSGIGRAAASRILREGGRVVAVDVIAERLESFADEADADMLMCVTADQTDAAQVAAVVAAADGRVDALANVAGISDDFAPIHEVELDEWRRVMGVNVDGPFLLTRAVIPLMLAARRGSIVNVASEASLRGSASGIAYTTSKHALVGITRNCAFMYAKDGIRVNAVAPGGVATGMGIGVEWNAFGKERTQALLNLMPPIATAEQVAASITFLLSDDATNITGAVLPTDGGWSVQ